MDMYTNERYKRWVRQKIRNRIGAILIVLLLLTNTALLFVLVFDRPMCECLNENDYSEIDDIEEYDENQEETSDGNEYYTSIPGRYAFLTFDDGPSAYTRSILDVLAKSRAPAIFFVIGDSINNRSDSNYLLNRILEEGHYIGLHTMTHNHDILYVGEGAPQRFVDEMFELNDLISEMILGGFSTNLCRAAFGMSGGTFTAEHHTAVDQAGLYCIDWNVDSQDWKLHTAYMIYQNVTRQIESSSFPEELVILFHEKAWTVEVLPSIIDYLRFHGYTITATISGDSLTYRQY